jgi:hypothetical protein
MMSHAQKRSATVFFQQLRCNAESITEEIMRSSVVLEPEFREFIEGEVADLEVGARPGQSANEREQTLRQAGEQFRHVFIDAFCRAASRAG